MNFNHPNFEGPAFPAGGAPHQPSSAGASGPHPAGPSHPQPQPHPAGPSHPQPQPHSAPHPHPPHPSFPHPHHPSYPSYPSYPYSRPSLFNWSSTWPFQSHFYASPAHHPSLHPSFAPSSRHAAPPPPPYAHYPQPFDRQAWRRAGRSGGRGRIWPFLLLAGGGLYAYKCLKHEVRDVKLALVETSEDAARVLEESEKGWCEGRWKREDGREPGWGLKEREARWKEWQAQMAATLEKPSSMSSEAKQEASKLV